VRPGVSLRTLLCIHRRFGDFYSLFGVVTGLLWLSWGALAMVLGRSLYVLYRVPSVLAFSYVSCGQQRDLVWRSIMELPKWLILRVKVSIQPSSRPKMTLRYPKMASRWLLDCSRMAPDVPRQPKIVQNGFKKAQSPTWFQTVHTWL
jgi:hypothetical protein